MLKIDHVWPPSRTRASWTPPRARGPPPVPQGRPRRTVRSGPSGKRRRGRYFCAHLMGPAAGMWEEEGSKVFKKSDEKRDSRSKYHFASNGTALVPRPTPSLVPVAGEVSLARVITWFYRKGHSPVRTTVSSRSLLIWVIALVFSKKWTLPHSCW